MKTLLAIASALLVACQGPTIRSMSSNDNAFSVEQQQVRNLVTLCGAGSSYLNTGRLVATLERTKGSLGVEFENEFKAAVMANAPNPLELYKVFVECLRSNAHYLLPDGTQYSSEKLVDRLKVLDPGVTFKDVSNWFGPDQVDLKYDAAFENRSGIPLTCRVRISVAVVKTYSLENPLRRLWSARRDISLNADRGANLQGSVRLDVPELRRTETLSAFVEPLACWRL